MQKIHYLNQINLTNLPKNTVFFIDVDDTIITPCSSFFNHMSPYRDIIDDIKENKFNLENPDLIVSNWRLKRKVKLVTDEWTSFFANIEYPVYGLTKIGIGQFGNIKSVEEWRYQELSSLGIFFTTHFDYVHDLSILGDQAKFHKGIFATGSSSKGQVLNNILDPEKIEKVVFIDDKTHFIDDVNNTLHQLGIQSDCYLFRGIENNFAEIDPMLLELQRDMLLKGDWLEDEEAKNYMLQYPRGDNK